MPDRIPSYVLVARISSVLGMSFSLAIGLLMLIGGWLLPALLAFLFFAPFIGLLVFVERHWATVTGATQPD